MDLIRMGELRSVDLFPQADGQPLTLFIGASRLRLLLRCLEKNLSSQICRHLGILLKLRRLHDVLTQVILIRILLKIIDTK